MTKVLFVSPSSVPLKDLFPRDRALYIKVSEPSCEEDWVEAAYVKCAALVSEAQKGEDVVIVVSFFKEGSFILCGARPSMRQWTERVLSSLTAPILRPVLFKEIRWVIFDMDGLLLDTEGVYTMAQKKVLEPFGAEFNNEVKCLMMGRSALKGAEVLVRYFGLEDQLSPQEFVDKRSQYLKALLPQSKLLPGVERLLKHLRSHGVPSAVATGSDAKGFQLKTSQNVEFFRDYFHHIVTSDQVTLCKPDPEIFLLAATRFEGYDSSDKESVLVLEDSPLGIEAACSAGFNSVLYETEYNKNCSVRPNQKVESLLDFRPEFWGLPPFEV